MSANEDPLQRPAQPQAAPIPLQNHSPWLLYSASILVILLAISFTFYQKPNLPNYTTLTSILSSHKSLLLGNRNPDDDRIQQTPSFCLLWMAPFLSSGGYSSEAWSYITSIHTHTTTNPNTKFKLAIEHHGDMESIEFWNGLPKPMRTLATNLHHQTTDCKMNSTIVICHSEPGAWNPPLFQTLPCPPTARYKDYLAVVGRTMFETDRVNPVHVKRCNKMDYVWVPTDFHLSTFVQSGVDPSKVVKIIQPVDVDFFDPIKYEQPLDLASVGELVLGKPRKHRVLSQNNKEFVFLSIFKWEYRKGWDILLQAYLKEFSRGGESEQPPVALYLLTNPYHSDNDFGNKIVEFVEDSLVLDRPKNDGSSWAPVYVINQHISQVDLPRLYKSADAFVLPSRGEGWGRPIVEAMAMGMPVIATNWSGPTEFLNDRNGYPLPVEKMTEVVDGPFKGHLWAEPSVDKLGFLMRHVVNNLEEGKRKGKQAREDMMVRFSPEVVAEIVSHQIQKILRDKS